MAKTLNPDLLYSALVRIMEAKHNTRLSMTVARPDGSIVGRYGSLVKKGA